MTRMLSFYLRFVKRPSTRAPWIGVWAGLVLVPFGPEGQLLPEPQESWSGFRAESSLLWSARLDRVVRAGRKSCAELWSCVVRSEAQWGVQLSLPWESTLGRAWYLDREPNEIAGIKRCVRSPCTVKLGRAEVDRLAASSEGDRPVLFHQLVAQRLSQYRASGDRPPYEEGRGRESSNRGDPWLWFETHGYRVPVSASQSLGLWARAFNLDPRRMNTLRQVMDRQQWSSEHGTRWTERSRDVYSNHYFDAWGEWRELQCSDRSVRLAQALVMDLDLLKKRDLLSVLGRGEMRRGVKTHAEGYLRQVSDRLAACAAAETP